MSLTWIWFCGSLGVVLAYGFTQAAFDASYYMGAALFLVWLRDRWGLGGGPVKYREPL
jgi:hypothetical protein